MPLNPKVYQFLVGLFASLGSLLYGYDLGVIAQVIEAPAFVADFNEPSPNATGAVVSVFTGGAFFGAAFAGPTGDWLGRRLTIMTGALIFILGGALQTGAQTLGYMYAGRVFAGVGVGFLVMIVPLYQSELAHPSIRGRITALVQFMLGIGALAAAWISYGVNVGFADDNDGQYRTSLGIQVIPAVILAALIMIFPESPRWLISKGKVEKGLHNLAKLHSHGDESDPWVQAEFSQIQESIAFVRENEAQSYMELFKDKSCFRRLFLACALQASVQMTGVSAIQYYSITIYKQMGIEANDALKYQAISSVLALCGQALCIALIDRLGRRWPLIFGNLTNCLMFIIATIMLAVFPPGDTGNASASWGFIAVTWLYNFSFSSTCGPLSWIIPAEIFDSFAGRLPRYHDLICLQHHDRTGHQARYGDSWLEVLFDGIIDLQLHKRRIFLLLLARDLQAPARGNELPLHQRSFLCARHEQEGLAPRAGPSRRSRCGQARLRVSSRRRGQHWRRRQILVGCCGSWNGYRVYLAV